jgi:hypothetical protein
MKTKKYTVIVEGTLIIEVPDGIDPQEVLDYMDIDFTPGAEGHEQVEVDVPELTLSLDEEVGSDEENDE